MSMRRERKLDQEFDKAVYNEGLNLQDKTTALLVQALNDSHEKHEQQIRRILRELHAEQEKSLASVVDHAVRKAITEVTPAPVQSVVLPVATGQHHTVAMTTNCSQGNQKPSTQVSTYDEEDDNTVNTARKSALQDAVKTVRKQASAVERLARSDREESFNNSGLAKIVESCVNNKWFDYFVAVVILFNTICIAVQTEFAARNPHRKTPSIFRAFDVCFTIFFTVELAAKIFVEKKQFFYGRNKFWNLYDAFVVGSAITEEFLNSATNTTAIRVLRIMRLVRVIRVIRTLRIFADLRAMVRGIVASILSLIWALVLLFVILLVFAIFITQVVTSYRKVHNSAQTATNIEPTLDDYLDANFGSLGDTIYSLYKAITGGDDWAAFADPLFNVSPVLGVFFCLYVAFAVFAVLNVVTGVFVDNAIKANSHDTDMIIMEQTDARKKHIEDVKSIFAKADIDDSGKLNYDEFVKHIDNPMVQAYFRQLDLDIEGSGATSLFRMLDFDDNGFIDIEEFVFGCGHLKGYARSLDMARIAHGQRRVSKKLLDHAGEQAKNSTMMYEMYQKLDKTLDSLVSRLPAQNRSSDSYAVPRGTSSDLPKPEENGHMQKREESVNPPPDLPGSVQAPVRPPPKLPQAEVAV